MSILARIVTLSTMVTSLIWAFGTRSTLSSDDLTITIREGTNMALALAPDHNRYIIDLQGTLWSGKLTEKKLTPLTDKLMDARQPHWSPRGDQIVFQAYADGNWHLFVMDTMNYVPNQVTSGQFDHREPIFSPDGHSVVFASDRSGNYDLWRLDLSQNRFTSITDTRAYDEYGPAISSDGDRITYVAQQGSSSHLRILEVRTHDVVTIYESDKKIFAPTFDLDKDQIYFIEIDDIKSKLRKTSAVPASPNYDCSDDDEDVFPFRPALFENKIIYTADGHIYSREMGSNKKSTIPFEAVLHLDRPSYPRKARNLVTDSRQEVKGIYQPVISPQGNYLAFIALGDLWIQPAGLPCIRLTHDQAIQLSPSWSHDQQKLAFASDVAGQAAIYAYHVTRKTTEKITNTDGLVTGIDWAPDDQQITYTINYGPRSGTLWKFDLGEGNVKRIGRPFPYSVSAPSWSEDGKIIAVSVLQPYSTLYREGINRITYTEIADGSRHIPKIADHQSYGMRGNDGPIFSPDGRKLSFLSQGFLWTVELDAEKEFQGQPRQVTQELTDAASWHADGTHIFYQSPQGFKTINILDGHIENWDLQLAWEKPKATQSILIRAGHLFDGSDSLLRKNQDIIIRDRQIVSISDYDAIHTADTIIEARDKFVIPGLIDVHAHQGSDMGASLGMKWLAWGVTSTRDPATNPYDALNRREAYRSGSLLGPRMFFTGSPLDGNRVYYGGTYALQNREQMQMEIERAGLLDYDLIKTYVRLPDHWQHHIVTEAHKLGIPVSSHELYPAVSYGIDGIEHILGTSRRGHNTKMSRILHAYQDVTDLIAKSGVYFTPTVGIYASYDLLLADNPEILKDPRIALEPDYLINAATAKIEHVNNDRNRWETIFDRASQMILDVHMKGGKIVAGTDGPIIPFGLGLHLELEAYQRAGLPTHEVLRSTTKVAAEYLGAEAYLGTITPGKLADLLILDSNPLTDIKNLRQIDAVILDGTLVQNPGLPTYK